MRMYFLRSRQRLGYFYLYANASTKYQQNVSRRAHCLAEVPAWVRFLAFAARLNLLFFHFKIVFLWYKRDKVMPRPFQPTHFYFRIFKSVLNWCEI